MLIDILGPPRLWCQTNTRRASEREKSTWSLLNGADSASVSSASCYFFAFRTFHLFAEPIVVLPRLSPGPIYTLRFDSCKINFSLSFRLRMLAIWPFDRSSSSSIAMPIDWLITSHLDSAPRTHRSAPRARANSKLAQLTGQCRQRTLGAI